MESTLVIKVKFGDTLRRFTARVDDNNQLDLDMVGLRAKICSLFNFTADANLMLRYLDEDGDLVALVEDDDLHDMMRQPLKFLRIEVHISNDSGGKSNDRSSGNATPLRSPQVPNQILGGNIAIADVLKSVQAPLHEALSNLCLVSKAVSSGSPVLANLTDFLSKMGNPILYSHYQPHIAAGQSSRNGDPGQHATPEATGPPSTNVDSASGKPAHAFAELISKLGKPLLNSHYQPHVAANPSSENDVPGEHVTPEARGPQSAYVVSTSKGARGQPVYVISTSKGSQHVEAGNVTRGVVTGVVPVDLNILPCDPYSSQSTNVNIAPLSSAVPGSDGKKGKMPTNDSFAGKGGNCRTSSSSAAPNNCSNQTTAMSSNAFIKCPMYTRDSAAPSLGNYHIHPFKRSYSQVAAASGMFHKGVRCDGCGVYPITGPRFKSKVKENYDLCSICFNVMGNTTDYIRIDRPVSVHSGPRCFKGVSEHQPWMGVPTLPHTLKTGSILKHARAKLDSRFILDVNVIDGTMMAPSTAFTKIWRMRNSGTLVWPRGTQLVWIGGDSFSDSHSVDLEVPEDGVPVDKELDIAVNFRAPQLPGRYISYWRMAAPSGQKFGQRVWVLIQVDASLKDSFYDSSQGLNLNIPLDVNGSKGPRVIDINVRPIEDDTFLQPHNPNAPIEPVNQMVDDTFLQPHNPNTPIEPVNQMVDALRQELEKEPASQMVDVQPRQELENEFPINEATFVGAAASPSATPAAPSSVSYPIIDFSETTPVIPSSQQSSAMGASASLGIGGNDSVEETLLKELEEMGFKEVDLNKEILRMNEYNLEQSVDDLCGVSEWDPILEELKEMGFRDNEMNKRLLMKNNGSIKRVVMDLINGEQV